MYTWIRNDTSGSRDEAGSTRWRRNGCASEPMHLCTRCACPDTLSRTCSVFALSQTLSEHLHRLIWARLDRNWHHDSNAFAFNKNMQRGTRYVPHVLLLLLGAFILENGWCERNELRFCARDDGHSAHAGILEICQGTFGEEHDNNWLYHHGGVCCVSKSAAHALRNCAIMIMTATNHQHLGITNYRQPSSLMLARDFSPPPACIHAHVMHCACLCICCRLHPSQFRACSTRSRQTTLTQSNHVMHKMWTSSAWVGGLVVTLVSVRSCPRFEHPILSGLVVETPASLSNAAKVCYGFSHSQSHAEAKAHHSILTVCARILCSRC